MHDSVVEQQNLLYLVDKAITELKERGKAFAKAEHDYRVALSKFILEKRNEGIPVTIISDVCRGDRKIAELRLNKDICESLYVSCKEAINVYKLKIKVIEGQIDREWSRSGGN